jgi:hypothetical protein
MLAVPKLDRLEDSAMYQLISKQETKETIKRIKTKTRAAIATVAARKNRLHINELMNLM